MRSSLSALRESTLKNSCRWGFSPYDDHRTPTCTFIKFNEQIFTHVQELFDKTRYEIKVDKIQDRREDSRWNREDRREKIKNGREDRK